MEQKMKNFEKESKTKDVGSKFGTSQSIWAKWEEKYDEISKLDSTSTWKTYQNLVLIDNFYLHIFVLLSLLFFTKVLKININYFS